MSNLYATTLNKVHCEKDFTLISEAEEMERKIFQKNQRDKKNSEKNKDVKRRLEASGRGLDKSARRRRGETETDSPGLK